MNTLLPSLIRTYVPLAVSWIAGWLITLGIDVTTEQQAMLANLFGAIVAALYYLVARVLEKQFPWATVLLGSPVQPAAYAPAAPPDVPPPAVLG